MRQLSDLVLCAFLAIAPNLQSLELASAPLLFSSSYLNSTADSRPSSAALTFNRFLLEVKGKLSTTLNSVNLSRTSISNRALESLANIPNLRLKKISLVSCKDLTDAGVVALCTSQPTIEELDISSNSQLTAISVQHVANKLKGIRSLNITKIKLQSSEAKILNEITSCSKLVLNACLLQLWVKSEADSAFSSWSSTLQSLDMSYCSGLSNQVVVSMCQRLTNLQQLDLSSCYRIDDVSLREISKCLISLTKLSVAWCKHITDMGLIGVYHEGFAHTCAKECRCGREKDFAYFEYTPPVKDIAPRVVIPTVGDINAALQHFGAEGRFPLWRMNKLRSLDLSVCGKISDASVIDAIDFPELTELNLAMCSRLTDKSVIAIASHNGLLERVNLSQCHQITDQSVAALLAGCRRIVHLNISGCPLITDLTIDCIIKHRIHLKSLDVSMCNISLEALERLEQLSPSLQTIHKRYTAAASTTQDAFLI